MDTFSLIETVLGIGLVVVVIAVAAIVIYFAAKKDNASKRELVAALNPAQKEALMDNYVEIVDERKLIWVQKAMLAKVEDKGSKVRARLLWYNSVIENNEYQTITIADTSIDKNDYIKYGLREGMYVRLLIDMNKQKSQVVF